MKYNSQNFVKSTIIIDNIKRLKIIAIIGSLVNVFIICMNYGQLNFSSFVEQDTFFRVIWIAVSFVYYISVGKVEGITKPKTYQVVLFYLAAFSSLFLSALITTISYSEQGTIYLFNINMLLTGAVFYLTVFEFVILAAPSFIILMYSVLTVPQPILIQKGNIINIIAVGVFSILIAQINYNSKAKQLQYQEIIHKQTEELRRLSEIDDLTGIENRRKIMERLDEIWILNARSNNPFSVLMIDIDHFKNFNDANGHLAGDACLKQVAQSIKESLPRATDYLGRYGGEEFIVILSGTELAGALTVSESIRHGVMDRHIKHSESIEPYITVSIGFACQSNEIYKTAEELLNAADQALYHAKQSGRNCVRS